MRSFLWTVTILYVMSIVGLYARLDSDKCDGEYIRESVDLRLASLAFNAVLLAWLWSVAP